MASGAVKRATLVGVQGGKPCWGATCARVPAQISEGATPPMAIHNGCIDKLRRTHYTFVRYEVANKSNKALLLKKVTKHSGTKVGVLSMGKSVSFCKGKGSLAHNNREFFTNNVDQSRTPSNIVYKQEPIAEAYEKLFGEEVRRYNEGKKPSRQIPDYMEHIRKSKNGEKLFYENVVQVGTMYSCPVGSADGETASKILDEYMRGFEQRNPNIYVFNAVLHLDEATPHLHIDWIPIARDYKNGLQIRNSLDKALKQQGIDGTGGKKGNSTQNWQEQERRSLISVMERYGWEYEASLDTDRGNLTVDQYKAMVEEVDHRIEALPDQIEKKAVPLSKDKVMVSASDLEALEQRANLTQTRETVTGHLRDYRAEREMEIVTYVSDKKQEAELEAQKMLEAIKKKKAEAEKDASAAFSMKQNLGRDLAEVRNLKSEYKKLYEAQRGLNEAYKEVTAENARLKAENGSLRTQIDDLKAEIGKRVQEAVEPLKTEIEALKTRLRGAYEVLTDIVKAVGMMKYDKKSGFGVDKLTKKQDRLIDSVADLGVSRAEKEGFSDLAEDMQKHIGVSPELKKLIGPTERGIER